MQSELHDPSRMIGKGITDHPHFAIRSEWALDDSPVGRNDHAKLALRHREAADEHFPYNIEVLVNYQYWDRRIADEDIWNQEIVMPLDRIGIDVQFFFPSALGKDNYVRLDQSSKKLLLYTAPNNGGRRYAGEIRDAAETVLDEITGGRDPRWQSDLLYFAAAQIGHAGGTLRIGDPGLGVVDATQRFHEYDNLYAGDLSVFPSILAAKPSLTLAALSLRLADTLLDQLPHRSGDPNYRGVRRRREHLAV